MRLEHHRPNPRRLAKSRRVAAGNLSQGPVGAELVRRMDASPRPAVVRRLPRPAINRPLATGNWPLPNELGFLRFPTLGLRCGRTTGAADGRLAIGPRLSGVCVVPSRPARDHAYGHNEAA